MDLHDEKDKKEKSGKLYKSHGIPVLEKEPIKKNGCAR
jgi:hypothetical protein